MQEREVYGYFLPLYQDNGGFIDLIPFLPPKKCVHPPSTSLCLSCWLGSLSLCLCTVTVLHRVLSQEQRRLEGIDEMKVDIGLQCDGYFVCVCCVLLSSLQFCFLFFVFVLFLYVCGDRDLAAHMHILGKCWVLVLLCVGGVETVEKEVIGGRSTCWCICK